MHFLSVESLLSEALPLRIYRCLCQFFAWNYASDFILRIHVSLTIYYKRILYGMMWRLQGSGAIFVCWVSVKLRLLFTAGPYWQVVSARYAVWIFIDLWNLRPQNACSLSFLRPALKICVKNADFCVNANPGHSLIMDHKHWTWNNQQIPITSGKCRTNRNFFVSRNCNFCLVSTDDPRNLHKILPLKGENKSTCKNIYLVSNQIR